MRGLFSAKVPNSSLAEVRMGLLIEPIHMEDEDEDQENEKEDEKDGEECRVEGRRVSKQKHHADDTWMTCAQDTGAKVTCDIEMCAVKREKCDV